MRRSRIKLDLSWPSWRYGPNGESAIFPSESDVPEGWTRRPGEADEPEIDRPHTVYYDYDDLIRQLNDRNIKIDPLWCNAHMQKVIEEHDISTSR